jgi:hypothetical protein
MASISTDSPGNVAIQFEERMKKAATGEGHQSGCGSMESGVPHRTWTEQLLPQPRGDQCGDLAERMKSRSRTASPRDRLRLWDDCWFVPL